MKVVLPDSSELELPDGASGLDAARAIGPKLAEQAVLARVDGETRDLRLPLTDGESVVTTLTIVAGALAGCWPGGMTEPGPRFSNRIE